MADILGQSLLPEARYLLDRAARLADIARQAGGSPGGTLSLGYVPSAGSTVLPELVRRLRKLQPSLNLELREMISDEQTAALVGGHIDAGLARTAARHARVAVACQLPDAFCLALPSAEARAAGPTLDLRGYADHAFVAFTRHRGPAYFDQSIHLCSQAGFSPRIRYEASTVHGVLGLVSAGLGVALVPASTALLGIKGALLRPLHRTGPGEVLSLLRRKVDANPMLPVVENAVARIFSRLHERVSAALRAR